MGRVSAEPPTADMGRGMGPRETTTMERRKFLIGAGSAAVGSSAIIGSGAFTSVEAEREVSIEVAGDANAFLTITRARDDGGTAYPNAQEYVEVDDNGEVSLDFTNAEDTEGSSASGINQDAKTIFDNLLDITNNGTQEVVLSVDSDLIASQGGFLGVYVEGEKGNPNDGGGLSNAESGQTVTLGPGESATNIGVYVPKGATDQVESGTLTFVAERKGGNRD